MKSVPALSSFIFFVLGPQTAMLLALSAARELGWAAGAARAAVGSAAAPTAEGPEKMKRAITNWGNGPIAPRNLNVTSKMDPPRTGEW